MGPIITFLYASIFPDKVDVAIGIDSLKPLVLNPRNSVKFLRDRIEGKIKIDKFSEINSEPPSYTYEEIKNKWIKASSGSITEEAVHNMLQRNINRKSGKFSILI